MKSELNVFLVGIGILAGGAYLMAGEAHNDSAQVAPPTITSGPLVGAPTEQVKFVKTNFADDWARCRAFFTIAANGNPDQTEHVPHPPLATEADQMMLMLVGLETTAAKSMLAMDVLSKEMDYDYTNFSRLIVNHGDFCKYLYTEPEARFNYWVKEAKRQIVN